MMRKTGGEIIRCQKSSEDLIEEHKILNRTNNLNSFQSRPDDKASEHELKLQINTLGTDVGKNFFPNTASLKHAVENPPKSLATLKLQLESIMRSVSRILEWAK